MKEMLFEELPRVLQEQGPEAALQHLCRVLKDIKDYDNLFYALLLGKRQALGVRPVPAGAAQDLPTSVHAVYEEAIRQACRTVGELYLQEGNIPRAWPYFRMLGETEPVARALERYQPGPDEDCQPLIDIAYHQGVHPRRGFDWILERYGICNAITTLGSGLEAPFGPEVRTYCIRRLVRALYAELQQRLRADIAQHEGQEPPADSIPQLLAGRDWLFAEEFAYHVDVSHLSAVVQLAIHLPPGPELELARELCLYGQRLSPRLQYASEPPFEETYRDYGLYLAALAGDQVEEALEHFRRKIEQYSIEEVGTYPVEILVNLYYRTSRLSQALELARRHLTQADHRSLLCPNIFDLCVRARDYDTLLEVARQQNNPVYYLAGLLAARQERSRPSASAEHGPV